MGLAAVAIVATLVSTAVAVEGQRRAGKAQKSQAKFQAQVAENNRIIANRNAEDARLRGEAEARRSRLENAQFLGRQRAALAASGQDVNQGTAADLQADTAAFGELDALTIRSNAEREAAGFEAQGVNFGAESGLQINRAREAQRATRFRMASTAVSGVGSVASRWYQFNTTTS